MFAQQVQHGTRRSNLLPEAPSDTTIAASEAKLTPHAHSPRELHFDAVPVHTVHLTIPAGKQSTEKEVSERTAKREPEWAYLRIW